MFDLSAYLEERCRRVDAALEECLPPATDPPALLHEAMRYSVLGGGKRLRPILCLAAAEAVGGGEEDAMTAACAVELLHAYTLVHDDLPAMDNDDLRRGRPTVHRAFGEANAILAGDCLLTLSFELLAASPPPPPWPPGQLALILARAVGSRGVAGGQYDDLAAEGAEPSRERVESIHLNKTGKLMGAACRMGGVAAGGSADAVDALGTYGLRLGLAFQIADDILNVTSTPEALGKAVGSDADRRKMSYVALAGLEGARARAEALVGEALEALAKLPAVSEPLAALARYALERGN